MKKSQSLIERQSQTLEECNRNMKIWCPAFNKRTAGILSTQAIFQLLKGGLIIEENWGFCLHEKSLNAPKHRSLRPLPPSSQTRHPTWIMLTNRWNHRTGSWTQWTGGVEGWSGNVERHQICNISRFSNNIQQHVVSSSRLCTRPTLCKICVHTFRTLPAVKVEQKGNWKCHRWDSSRIAWQFQGGCCEADSQTLNDKRVWANYGVLVQQFSFGTKKRGSSTRTYIAESKSMECLGKGSSQLVQMIILRMLSTY